MPPFIERENRPGDPKRQPVQNEHSANNPLQAADSSQRAKPGETGVLFESSSESTINQPLESSLGEELPAVRKPRSIPRDLERWPETNGYPPIMGGSGQEDSENAAREFWKRFLRASDPDQSEDDINREVEKNMNDPEFLDWAERARNFIEEQDRQAKEENVPTYFEFLRRYAEQEKRRKKR